MNTDNNNREDARSVVVRMGRHEIALNAEQVEVLAQLAEDDWATVREMVSFGDAVVTALAIGDRYEPSEAGAAAAVRVVADMKQLLLSMIGDRTYGQFQ